jgi:hypothetical protein
MTRNIRIYGSFVINSVPLNISIFRTEPEDGGNAFRWRVDKFYQVLQRHISILKPMF